MSDQAQSNTNQAFQTVIQSVADQLELTITFDPILDEESPVGINIHKSTKLIIPVQLHRKMTEQQITAMLSKFV